MFVFFRKLIKKEKNITVIPYEELGYKCAWFAIPANDIESVKQYLLSQNYQVPIQLMLKSNYVLIYLSEEPLEDDFNINILQYMSKLYDSAYYFCSDRRVDFYEWRKYEYGKNIRSFQYYSGEGVLIDDGELTEAEQTLKLDFSNWNNLIASDVEPARYLDEEDVINVAKLWLKELYITAE